MNAQKKLGEDQLIQPVPRGPIAGGAVRYSTGHERPPSARGTRVPADVSARSLAAARRMVRERLRRSHHFDSSLFADPAWDMMLDLFIAEGEGRETPVMNLCLSSQVPETTTLRWVKTLEQAGIVIRQRDEHDQRRVLVRLSPDAARALAAYLEEAA